MSRRILFHQDLLTHPSFLVKLWLLAVQWEAQVLVVLLVELWAKLVQLRWMMHQDLVLAIVQVHQTSTVLVEVDSLVQEQDVQVKQKEVDHNRMCHPFVVDEQMEMGHREPILALALESSLPQE